ncbi:MAG: CBS domain-containing protein [Pseudomonadales bacterium]|jgi:CBS domain containing-hemolysin-like protein|nr:CBS domain-containing protein [Pseudomonadales bacterium]
MKALPIYRIQRDDHLVWPDEVQEIDWDSPAEAVFTDFREHEPLVIAGSMSAEDGARQLRQTHALLKLVVDQDGDFVGIVRPEDLSEQSILRLVACGARREDICVRDLMLPRAAVCAIDRADLHRATVGDLVKTLRHHGQAHCLVVDEGAHEIRGVISAEDLARRLHVRIRVDTPPTFAQIHQAVRH